MPSATSPTANPSVRCLSLLASPTQREAGPVLPIMVGQGSGDCFTAFWQEVSALSNRVKRLRAQKQEGGDSHA